VDERETPTPSVRRDVRCGVCCCGVRRETSERETLGDPTSQSAADKKALARSAAKRDTPAVVEVLAVAGGWKPIVLPCVLFAVCRREGGGGGVRMSVLPSSGQPPSSG
jgi:hypothetical protein